MFAEDMTSEAGEAGAASMGTSPAPFPCFLSLSTMYALLSSTALARGSPASQKSSRYLAGPRLPPRLAPPSSSVGPLGAQRQRRRQGRSAAAVTTSAALLSPAVVFDAATALVLPFYVAMIVGPRKPFTRRLLGSGPVFIAGAALYGLLLAAWNPLPQLAAAVHGAAAAVQSAAAAAGSGVSLTTSLRAALPSMPAFAALFSIPEITVVAWVHLVLLDLLQARWVHKDGLRNNVPIWHSAVLCFMAAPLGLLCHLATKAAVLRWRGDSQDQGYVVYRF